jgi:hypothetical protein
MSASHDSGTKSKSQEKQNEDKEKFDSEVVMSEYSKDMIERQAEIISIAQRHQHQVNEQYIATKIISERPSALYNEQMHNS